MPRCQTCCRNSWQLAILLPFDCRPLMHLCSADTWQLCGPRVNGANGGFLFPEIHLGGKLWVGNQIQEIPGRNRTSQAEILVLCPHLLFRFWVPHSIYFVLVFSLLWRILPKLPLRCPLKCEMIIKSMINTQNSKWIY